MRAIDLYSGIGGWALGLKLCGINVIESFEYWTPAVNTHKGNLGSDVRHTDIRTLRKTDLPANIDIVVGSPPCTQFSYSNRGGNGNLADGLKDIYKFFEVVSWLNPKYWAMENVPRVENIILKESGPGGALEEFAEIISSGSFKILDLSKFGIPQKRKRCICGNFDFALLNSYAAKFDSKSLGEVLNALHKKKVDPNYSTSRIQEFSDMDNEEYFSESEMFINRASKVIHPVYNRMSFPERLDLPSRTITATCTRVSRESVVIEAPEIEGKFRRLNVRERLAIQSFPTSYVLLGKSYAEKLKMVGNAIPPAFTYLIGQSILGKEIVTCFPSLDEVNKHLLSPLPVVTRPDSKSKSYRPARRFRFSIPGFNYKSGTQLELSNDENGLNWSVKFFFGNSKIIRSLELDKKNFQVFGKEWARRDLNVVSKLLEKKFNTCSSIELQQKWINVDRQGRLFDFLTMIGEIGSSISIRPLDVESFLSSIDNYATTPISDSSKGLGMAKVEKHIDSISIGILLGFILNLKIIKSDPIQNFQLTSELPEKKFALA